MRRIKSMTGNVKPVPAGTLTAAELRKLPRTQRNALLEAAAQLAEHDYRHDPELTAFEAFGKDDLYGDSSNAAPG
jgi:hypothetical protein